MKKLAVIGASYLQLPLVLKAKELGVEVHCFAWEDGAVCKEYADFFYPISIREKELILQQCERIGIDGITSIASDIAVSTINYVAEKLSLVGNPINSSVVTTNKIKMRECFHNNQVASPWFSYVKDSQMINTEALKFPLIVKPSDRSGSLGVSKVANLDELERALRDAINHSFSNEAILEEFVEGKEVSVETISWMGKHDILAITDKVTTGAPHFVELEHHQPSQLSPEVQEKIKAETIKALNALDHQFGAGHTEIKINSKDEVFVIEVGGRMGGDFIGSHLVNLSTGYDFLKGVIDVALGSYSEPVIIKNEFSGVLFLTKESEWLEDIIENGTDYSEIVTFERTSSDLRSVKSSSERSGYMIYHSDYKRWSND